MPTSPTPPAPMPLEELRTKEKNYPDNPPENVAPVPVPLPGVARIDPSNNPGQVDPYRPLEGLPDYSRDPDNYPPAIRQREMYDPLYNPAAAAQRERQAKDERDRVLRGEAPKPASQLVAHPQVPIPPGAVPVPAGGTPKPTPPLAGQHPPQGQAPQEKK